MILTEEQLNFLTRLNLQGPLTSDLLGDRLKGKDCDENAKNNANYWSEKDIFAVKDLDITLQIRCTTSKY